MGKLLKFLPIMTGMECFEGRKLVFLTFIFIFDAKHVAMIKTFDNENVVAHQKWSEIDGIEQHGY